MTHRAFVSVDNDRHNDCKVSRRTLLSMSAAAPAVLLGRYADAAESVQKTVTFDKAQIAITLDLEMSRNFPNWEDTRWDYQKGNLTQAAKEYTVGACRRVKERGGAIHTFVVGQVFEQPDVEWLKQIAAAGHPIGNHTYDHVYLLAERTDQVQYRFRRARLAFAWSKRCRNLAREHQADQCGTRGTRRY